MKLVDLPLVDALEKYSLKNSVRFHMPGHKGRQIGSRLKELGHNLYSWDVTEIPGMDDLHQPEGAIKLAQEKLAELYGADESFFLVNGASSGIIAMMGAAVLPGDEILIPRASHKSVLSGLILTGARPVYVMPELDEKLGVYTQVTAEAVKEAIEDNPGVKAALLTNPVYQGFCPDIESISKVVHSKSGILLVDEAQGPHFGFSSYLPKSAGEFADAWVQSPHKMLTSLTQSAWMHVKGDRINKSQLKAFIKLVTSTSPSYILMASLDMARGIMEAEGKSFAEKALELADAARQRINRFTPFYAVGSEVKGKRGICDIDLSRLMINVSTAGFTGYEVEERLRKDFNIYAEYADLCNVYFLVTFSNSKEDMERLTRALSTFKARGSFQNPVTLPHRLPQAAMRPQDAFYAPGEYVPLKESLGRVAKDALVPYPPGIPLLMPGELIEGEHIEILEELLISGGRCHGMTNGGQVPVVAEGLISNK